MSFNSIQQWNCVCVLFFVVDKNISISTPLWWCLDMLILFIPPVVQRALHWYLQQKLMAGLDLAFTKLLVPIAQWQPACLKFIDNMRQHVFKIERLKPWHKFSAEICIICNTDHDLLCWGPDEQLRCGQPCAENSQLHLHVIATWPMRLELKSPLHHFHIWGLAAEEVFQRLKWLSQDWTLDLQQFLSVQHSIRACWQPWLFCADHSASVTDRVATAFEPLGSYQLTLLPIACSCIPMEPWIEMFLEELLMTGSDWNPLSRASSDANFTSIVPRVRHSALWWCAPVL